MKFTPRSSFETKARKTCVFSSELNVNGVISRETGGDITVLRRGKDFRVDCVETDEGAGFDAKDFGCSNSRHRFEFADFVDSSSCLDGLCLP